MPFLLDRSMPSRIARQIALAFAAVAIGWVLAIDWLLTVSSIASEDRVLWGAVKGLAFVSVTSVLLFFLLRANLRQNQVTGRDFSGLVEHLPGVVYRCENDSRWTMRFISSAVRPLTGYAPEELVGNAQVGFAELVHPEDRKRVEEEVQHAIRADCPFRIEYRLCRRDGTVVWIWEQGRAVSDSDHKGRVVIEGLMLDITERKHAETDAKETAERLESLGDNLPGGAVYRLHRALSGQYRFTYASKGVERILGISREQMLADASAAFGLTEQPYRDAVHAANERSARDLSLFEMELPQRLPDGTRKWIVVRSLAYSAGDEGVIWDGVVLDITKSKIAEEKLREAAAVFASTAEGVVITTLDGEIRDVNRAFCRITGYRKEETIGQNPRILQSGRHDPAFYQAMWRSLEERGQWRGEIWNRRKDGGIYPELLTISVVPDAQGHPSGYVGVFTDITALKESEARLDHLARHDPLTTLPNRLMFDDRVRQAIRHAMRHNARLAVLFTDLDRFKHINDSFGHPAGDQLLQQFARRLCDTLRAEDTVARISGDEFVILLEGIESANNVVPVARKLIDALKEPFAVEGNTVRVTASIGISLYPDDGSMASTLLRNADAAMYRAKEEGGNSYAFYTREMTAAAFEQVFLDNALRGALDRDEFRLVYQPQFDLVSGRLLGIEALLRWHHPEQGVILPHRFIHIAEQTSLIVDIGRWVLRSACEQGRRWLDQGFDFGCLGVNVAGRQVHDQNFVGDIERVIADTKLPVNVLELEVSENFVMRRADTGVAKLKTLNAKGIGIAIDDFGTGYSSFSHLKRLPITKLKLDQSFVRGIPNDQNDMAICSAVIAMSQALDLVVIAEGIETEDQAAFLTEKGCRLGQGFLFARPMAPDAIEQLLVTAS